MKYLKLVLLVLFSLTLGGCIVVPSEPRSRIVEGSAPQVIVIREYPRYYYSYPTIWWRIGVGTNHGHGHRR